VSHGNSVTVGFEGLPHPGGSPRINTGLTLNGNPIYVTPRLGGNDGRLYASGGAEFQSWMPHIYISRGLNSRLQTTFLYSDNGQVENYYMYKSYDHNDGHNNGNILSVTNHKDNNRTQMNSTAAVR
jgi:hypothetical protein